MGKGVGNINRGKTDVSKGTYIPIKRSKYTKTKSEKVSKKTKRKSAIHSMLKSGDTTINILRQNKSNPNANVIMSGKKRRKIQRDLKISEFGKSKIDTCPLSALPQVKDENSKKMIKDTTTENI